MNRKKILFLFLLFFGVCDLSYGQSCPDNIDFETGTLSNWLYYTGSCCPIVTPFGTAPVPGRHDIVTGLSLDPIAGFPIVYPDLGSFSLKLGNNSFGAQAEKARYYVHIPATSSTYNLIYHYAVVLQDASDHTAANEPRMEINAFDSLTGAAIPCASYYVGLSTGGSFFNVGPYYYRTWTSGNIKLNGLAGTTVGIDFSTSDCGLGTHFGYGYVDMDCGVYSIILDEQECAHTSVTLIAPWGYAGYLWTDSATYSITYGTVRSSVTSSPSVTTTYAVILTPYSGFGCTDTLYTTVIPGHPVFNQSHDTTICFGATVTLTSGATTGFPALTYLWTPGAGMPCTTCDPVTVTPPVGVTAYSVSVTDAQGCVRDTFITVTTYPTPAAITGKDSVCLGLTTTLSNSVIGGVWSSSLTGTATIGSATGIVRGIAVGTSVITYSFGGGLCYTTATVTVNPLPTSFSGVRGTCVGGTTTLSNGSGSGTWSSGNTAVATIGSSTGVVTGAGAGTANITYSLSTTGCEASITVTIIPVPVVSVTPTFTGCGIVSFSATGTYSSYDWDFGDGTTGVGNPVSHTYSVTGIQIVSLTETDIYNCSTTDTIHLDVKAPPIVNLGRDTVLCTATSYTLQSLITYTTSPTYLWSTTAVTPTITVTTSGTYTLTVTEGFCSASDDIRVDFNPYPPVNLGNDTAFCIGNTLVLTSIQPPGTTYFWSTGSTATSIAVVLPGTYWLTVFNGCIASDTIRVSLAPPPYVNIGPDTLNCTGNPVTLKSPYPYPPTATFNWNTGSTTPAITVSSSGSYWLRVNVNGCAASDSADVSIIYDTATLHNRDTAICIGKSVQAVVSANPLATFQWVPTAGIAASTSPSPMITPDTSAMYRVNVYVPGCPTLEDSFFIEVQPYPVVYLGGNRAVCEFDTLHIGASVSPRWFTNYRFSWTPGTYLDDTTLSTVLFTAGDTTTLKLRVSTSAGCSGIDSALYVVYPGNFTSLKSDTDVCPHDTVVLKPQVTMAGVNVTYHWYPSLYLSDPLSAQPWALPITTQAYTVVATSQYGCTDTNRVNVVVHPAAVLFLGDSTVIYPGESYRINPQTNCSYFLWFPPQGLDNAYVSNPVATPQTNTYYVAHASTEWGCKTADSINIYVEYESLLQVPNAFVPGSGPNGKFYIVKRGLADLNYFRVFNRWGTKVFDTKNIDEGWDGKYAGTPQPFGVYVYEIEAVTSAGTTFKKHGNVTLIR